MIAKFETLSDAKAFIFAGNATFTIVSVKTGSRFTFKVNLPMNEDGKRDYNANRHFVSVMTGSDNESSYTYLGFFSSSVNGVRYQHGHKSKIAKDAASAKAFEWFAKVLQSDVLPSTLEVWHEGKCGRCNRKLTVPASISTGMGEDCAEKMGVFYAVAA